MKCQVVIVVLLVLLRSALAQDEAEGMLENFVEGSIKDLFTRELSTANNQNLTDCMTRLLCENICARASKGEIKGNPLVNTAEMFGTTEKDPLGYFFTGGDRGYEFGQEKQCHRCTERYPNCQPSQYETAKSITNKYERNMLKTAESSPDNDFLPV